MLVSVKKCPSKPSLPSEGFTITSWIHHRIYSVHVVSNRCETTYDLVHVSFSSYIVLMFSFILMKMLSSYRVIINLAYH